MRTRFRHPDQNRTGLAVVEVPAFCTEEDRRPTDTQEKSAESFAIESPPISQGRERERIAERQIQALEAPEPFVDAVRAAEFLSLRRRQVLELARKGRIPSHPLGEGARRTWRFRLSELASFLSLRDVDSRGPSPAPR